MTAFDAIVALTKWFSTQHIYIFSNCNVSSGRNYTPIPQIIIQGKWLRPLGFFVGDKVIVTQEGNRLIVEKCKDGHDAEEEDAMVAKSGTSWPELF